MIQPVFYIGDQILMKLIAQDLDRNPINITGATVKLISKNNSAVAVETSATVTDGAAGKAQALLDTAAWTAGDAWWEWRITITGAPVTGPAPRRHRDVVARLA